MLEQNDVEEGEDEVNLENELDDYLDALCLYDSIDPILMPLLQKYFTFPFIEVCASDGLYFCEPTYGPQSVVDGDICESYSSLADVLERNVSDNRINLSICSSESGKLLYGVPWKEEDQNSDICDEDEEEN
jgi:hypothetical protein